MTMEARSSWFGRSGTLFQSRFPDTSHRPALQIFSQLRSVYVTQAAWLRPPRLLFLK